MSSSLKVSIEFKGGIEVLFGNVANLELELNPNDVVGDDKRSDFWTIKELINLLKEKNLKERPELFTVNDTIRPGILILVNETDWEILGGDEYQIQNGDKILFISTLHGG